MDQVPPDEAFSRLYAQHYRPVHAYTARRVGAGDADEVTAEVFLTAWRRWPDPAAAGLPWLYATARRTVANHLRSRQRQDHTLTHLRAVAQTASAGGEGAVVEAAAAAAALLQLSARDREVLLALAWDGMSPAQLATVLGCRTATALVRIHRARRRLSALTDTSGDDTARPRQPAGAGRPARPAEPGRGGRQDSPTTPVPPARPSCPSLPTVEQP